MQALHTKRQQSTLLRRQRVFCFLGFERSSLLRGGLERLSEEDSKRASEDCNDCFHKTP